MKDVGGSLKTKRRKQLAFNAKLTRLSIWQLLIQVFAKSIRYACAFLCLLGVALTTSNAHAASPEAKVKTAYIYNLLRNTTWPAAAFPNDQTPYKITILGEDKLEGLLDKVAKFKQINNRSIVLKRINSMDEYTPCHLLYVPGTITPELSKTILEKTTNSPVLVIGETSGFCKQGATINFFLDTDGTTGYEMNLKAAAQHALKFESQMRELATLVNQ